MDIILRFRVHKVALAADIEKAFLMVSVAKKDRNALRFLWFDDIAKDDPKIIPLSIQARCLWGLIEPHFAKCYDSAPSQEVRFHNARYCGKNLTFDLRRRRCLWY